MHVPVSLSYSIYICKNGLDPDQTRMEFRKECFVNLKICACDRKYAKCRTKADAHDKMGFQYISMRVPCADPDQIRMEFRKECFVNLNIRACDRKHAKHQYCRISDFVVQKPMRTSRTRRISKYHFQHRYIFFEITRD